MYRAPLAVLVSAALALTPIALAEDGNSIDPTPTTCDRYTNTYHVRSARKMVRAAWAERKWQDRTPVHNGQREVIRYHIDCLDLRKDQRAIGRTWAKQRKQFRLWRRYRRAAPFAGFQGEGRYLRFLAVPAYIVACETNGYSGEGRWYAANPSSGASGPAQLLGWGQPYPADSPSEKVRYWEIAASVWSSSGSEAWACA
jgi:hypothetical protein